VFKAMAQRLADLGFVVLAPNPFYRVAPPFDPPLSIHKSGEFTKMMNLLPTVTRENVERDSIAYVQALQRRPDVRPGGLGCVGYCMSGQMAVWTAAANPDSIRVIASFHGGSLVTGAPDSAHRLAAQVKATMYFAHAEQDAFMTPENVAEFDATLAAAKADFKSEVYAGSFHGFAIPDAGYDVTSSERHWRALGEVLRGALIEGREKLFV
jgi:carboxymethylenebutenolidase